MVYFQNSGLTEAYGEDDRAWLEGYATAVGLVFGLRDRSRRGGGPGDQLRPR